MPRIRYLKPDFFTDEDLGELSFEARLTFAGLWCHADKAGRLEDRPKYLKAMIWPYDKIDIEKQLTLLESPKNHGTGFIRRYEVQGKKYIQILTWAKHQKPHHTEKESIIPSPPPIPQGVVSTTHLSSSNIYIRTIKGMGSVNKASTRLKNGEITVKSKKSNKNLYLECVYLTDEEYCKLKEKEGVTITNRAIEILNNYIMANGKKYKSHYHAILNWVLPKTREEIQKIHDLEPDYSNKFLYPNGKPLEEEESWPQKK